MKNKILSVLAFILTAAMLLSVLAACGNDGDNPDASEAVSLTDSQTEESSQAEPVPVTDPEFSTVISAGRAYNSSATPGEKYPDSYGIELTDGVFAAEDSSDYNQAAYVGYPGNTTAVITVDLGEKHDSIYEFRLGYLATSNAGITPPKSIRILASEDGNKYNPIGDMIIPEYVEGRRLEAKLRVESYVNARYIRFSISKAGWVFIDELQVIANTENTSDVSGEMLRMIKTAYEELGTVKFDGVNAPNEKYDLELISTGCKYTTSSDALPEYKDGGSDLTDGKITKDMSGGKWAGFKGGEAFTVTVDLGKTRSDLSDFRLTCYANSTVGSFLPVAVTYSVSDDGESFTEVGRIFGVTAKQDIYEYPLTLAKCASGRYVRFTVEATDTDKYLIEEAAVYAHTANGGASLYPYPVYDHVDKEWENASSKTENLALGIVQSVYIPSDVPVNTEQATPANTPLITDGKKASGTDIHNGKFFKFHSSSAPIEIYFDLGAASAVKSFSAQIIHREGWGITAPEKCTVFLSEDGESWYTAGSTEIRPESDNCLADATLTLKKPVKARYVCIYFMTNGWFGLSEIEIFGTKSTSGATTIEAAKYPARGSDALGYLAPNEELIKGYSDVCLLYHRTDRTGYSEEELLRYLAYVDTEGNIKDTMFDSFLFLQSGNMPSGTLGSTDHKASDLDWILDILFTEGQNIIAMEKVAGRIKSELGLPNDFKYGFAVTLYNPSLSNTDYGDIDGDGKSDAIASEADRLKAIEAYMKKFEAKLDEYSFENIEFMGYYWYHEGIYPENNDPYIVTEVSKIVHGRGYDLFWIPWYCAPGVGAWKDYGIDVAVMQPGYVFDEAVPEGRLEQAAYFIRSYGMGIEIEIGATALNNPVLYDRYVDYLMQGIKYGYMENCIHMYYQEISAYYDAATSGDSKVRRLYDYTYQFIKGTLDTKPDKLETVTVSGAKDAPIIGVVIDEALPTHSFNIVSQPTSGSVSMGNDGSFIYFPEKGFTGKIGFTYTYNEGLEDSDICTVEITVE